MCGFHCFNLGGCTESQQSDPGLKKKVAYVRVSQQKAKAALNHLVLERKTYGSYNMLTTVLRMLDRLGTCSLLFQTLRVTA